MFAALFPLAPLFALIFGLIDLRIDAHRLVWFNRRPIPVTTNGKIYKLIFPKTLHIQELEFGCLFSHLFSIPQ